MDRVPENLGFVIGLIGKFFKEVYSSSFLPNDEIHFLLAFKPIFHDVKNQMFLFCTKNKSLFSTILLLLVLLIVFLLNFGHI